MSDPDNKNQIDNKKKIKPPKSQLPTGIILDDRFKILERFNHGAFGDIYSGVDLSSNRIVAIKTENLNPPPPNHTTSLYAEQHFLNNLKLSAYVVPFYKYGRAKIPQDSKTIEIHYIAMKKLGENLQSLVKKQGHHFSLPTTIQIGVQMINCIQSIHEFGVVHRDVKPANFVLPDPNDNPEGTEMCIIDFGLSKYYKDFKTGKLVPKKESKGFRGTAKYASTNALKLKDLSRRDDLWSVFYSILDLALGRLPWTFLKNKQTILDLKVQFNSISNDSAENDKFLDYTHQVLLNDADFVKILNRAMTFSQQLQEKNSKIFQEMDKRVFANYEFVASVISFPIITPSGLPPQMIAFREHLKSLRFEDQPDYEYLKNLLYSWYQNCGFDSDLPYDWEKTENTSMNELLSGKTILADGEEKSDTAAPAAEQTDGDEEKVIDVKEVEINAKDVDIQISDKNADKILTSGLGDPEFIRRVLAFKEKNKNPGTTQTSSHSPNATAPQQIRNSPTKKHSPESNDEKFSAQIFFEAEPPLSQSPSSNSKFSRSEKRNKPQACSIM